jgi:DHA2 family multidrug resistance protein
MGPTLGGWITDNYSWRWVFYQYPGRYCYGARDLSATGRPAVGAQIGQKIDHRLAGIGLIALGLGLQVMLTVGRMRTGSTLILPHFRRADGSRHYRRDLLAAVCQKPVVDLRCMADKNFAVSSLLMAGMAMILYGSSVVIPQLAQQDLGYTATWSGLVLSPGRY